MDDQPAPDNANDDRITYLSGDPTNAPLDPPDRDELDALMAVLGDPTTWDEPSPDLGDLVVGAIASAPPSQQARSAAAPTTPPLTNVPPPVQGVQRVRRLRWLGPALLGAAAATLVAVTVAVTRDDDTSPELSVDATIELTGTDLGPGLTGTAEFDARQSGLWIRLDLPGLTRRDGDDFYEAWLRSEDGTGLIPIGTFHDGDDVILWAGVALADFPIITVTQESVAAPTSPDQGSSGLVVATGRLAP